MAGGIVIPDDGLHKVRVLVEQETGIAIDPKKDYFLRSRIVARAAALGCESFADYYHALLFNKASEMPLLTEEVTINETYFFRDYPQLRGFAEEVLGEYCDQKRKSGKTLNLWSAACSIGCEPYTLSIILREMIDDHRDWKTKILASDIDRNVLRKARLGIYDDRAVKDVPTAYKNKYFTREAGGWRIASSIKADVEFEHLNLIDRAAMRHKRGFDFIFCRNVLIYFNDATNKMVVGAFYDALLPGGYLFLGSSESVGRITAAFELQKKGSFLCYRKPLK